MPDNKTNKGSSDRNKVAGNESWEISYMIKKLGVTQPEILKAIKEVGNNRQRVEAYLKSKKNA